MSNDNGIVNMAVAQGWQGHSSVIVVRNKYLRVAAWEKVVELTSHRVSHVSRRTWSVTLGTLERPWIKLKVLEDDPYALRGSGCYVWLAPSCDWAAGRYSRLQDKWREFQKAHGMHQR